MPYFINKKVNSNRKKLAIVMKSTIAHDIEDIAHDKVILYMIAHDFEKSAIVFLDKK